MRHVEVGDLAYEGVPSHPRIDLALGQNHDLHMELIQQTDDSPSIYRDFIRPGREGMHHLRWFCEDYPAALASALAEGRAELQRDSWSGAHFRYHRPASGNGITTELIELTSVLVQAS